MTAPDATAPELADAAPRDAGAARVRWRVRLQHYLVAALISLVAAEGAARVFWAVGFGVPLLNPGRVLYSHYPGLRRIDAERPAHRDSAYDVLILGGSTLNPEWSSVERALREELTVAGHRNVRVYNLAMVGHTSRDSWLKYSNVGDARFELVLVYDGINDARANNAPPTVFRDDYGHFSWYGSVDALASHHRSAWFALPFTVEYVGIRVWHKLASGRYVPAHEPRADWVQYGRDVRSAGPFKHHLSAVVDLAAQRGDPVMLMTLATFVPPDYSLAAFRDKRLAYGLHISPLELWGSPPHVLGAVAAHNAIVRDLATRTPGVLFVDQAGLMPGGARYFNDACHLTVDGSRVFVANIVAALSTAQARN